MSDTRKNCIRQRIHALWETGGRQEGGALKYRELAERIVDEENNAAPPIMTEKPPL